MKAARRVRRHLHPTLNTSHTLSCDTWARRKVGASAIFR
jgi:hypothetical protein